MNVIIQPRAIFVSDFFYWLNHHTHGVEPTTLVSGGDVNDYFDKGEQASTAAKDWLEKHHPELLGTTPTEQ